jgi:hypothetical protein
MTKGLRLARQADRSTHATPACGTFPPAPPTLACGHRQFKTQDKRA